MQCRSSYLALTFVVGTLVANPLPPASAKPADDANLRPIPDAPRPDTDRDGGGTRVRPLPRRPSIPEAEPSPAILDELYLPPAEDLPGQRSGSSPGSVAPPEPASVSCITELTDPAATVENPEASITILPTDGLPMLDGSSFSSDTPNVAIASPDSIWQLHKFQFSSSSCQ